MPIARDFPSEELHLTIAELEKKLKNGQGGVAEQERRGGGCVLCGV